MGVLTSILHKLTRFSLAALFVGCLAILYYKIRFYFHTPICPTYGGFTHHAFEDVKRRYAQNIVSGYDKGSSFAIYRNGEPLVDLWGGCADEQSAKPWERDTLSQAWSSTKGVTAILLATLVDKGRLDVHQTVAHYWPEFAQNGKENITVGTLLSHQAGLTHLERLVSLHEYRDNWTEVEHILAKQAPLWEPGQKYLYHALTWGMYADALIRKVDEKQRNATQYFQEEIADHLGDLDFFIGLPRGLSPRTTHAHYVPMWAILGEVLGQPRHWSFLPEMVKHHDIINRAGLVFHFMKDPSLMEDVELRSIGLPSAHGFGNARSLARIFDFLANNGTVKGKTLLSSEAATLLRTGVNKDARAISAPSFTFTALGTAFESRLENMVGHRGYGGQIAYADVKEGISIGYVTNYKETFGMVEDPRAAGVIDVFYRCLETYKADQKRDEL